MDFLILRKTLKIFAKGVDVIYNSKKESQLQLALMLMIFAVRLMVISQKYTSFLLHIICNYHQQSLLQ